MKKILFVCVENSCRSQMAKGFFNKFTKNAVADSAGTQPSENVNPVAVKVMNEVGVDIKNNKPKQLTSEMNNKFDFIVTMGCMDGCPITPKNKTIEWNIEDPKGKNIEFYRNIRDQIKSNVKNLVNEMI
jgi:arsenate reductase (thioredoxin)